MNLQHSLHFHFSDKSIKEHINVFLFFFGESRNVLYAFKGCIVKFGICFADKNISDVEYIGKTGVIQRGHISDGETPTGYILNADGSASLMSENGKPSTTTSDISNREPTSDKQRSPIEEAIDKGSKVNDALGAASSLQKAVVGGAVIATNKLSKVDDLMAGVKLIKDIPAVGVIGTESYP